MVMDSDPDSRYIIKQRLRLFIINKNPTTTSIGGSVGNISRCKTDSNKNLINYK